MRSQSNVNNLAPSAFFNDALYTIHKMQGFYTCEQHVAILSSVVVSSFIKLFATGHKLILKHLTRMYYYE